MFLSSSCFLRKKLHLLCSNFDSFSWISKYEHGSVVYFPLTLEYDWLPDDQWVKTRLQHFGIFRSQSNRCKALSPGSLRGISSLQASLASLIIRSRLGGHIYLAEVDVCLLFCLWTNAVSTGNVVFTQIGAVEEAGIGNSKVPSKGGLQLQLNAIPIYCLGSSPAPNLLMMQPHNMVTMTSNHYHLLE